MTTPAIATLAHPIPAPSLNPRPIARPHRALGPLLTLALTGCLQAADYPQWRGPARDGRSPETGLLAEWPANGPQLVWQINDLGSGYSTPAIQGDRLYVLSNEGLDHEFVQARLASNGTKLWATRLGQVGKPDQQPKFPAARSTPTVVGDALYALGSDGDLVCLETETGKVRWRRHLRTDFGGVAGVWAYAESPLVDGSTLLCTPGGKDATLLALNRLTGEPLWRCALPEADEAAYASGLVLEAAGRKQYVQLLQKGLVGVDAQSGQFLWRFPKATSRYNANIPTPVIAGDTIYVGSAGTGGGAVRLAAKDGAIVPEQLYFEAKLPTAIGGAVKAGPFLYGTTAQALLCVEFATGLIRWEDRALGAASICLAEDRLYLHGENGAVALVEATPESYRERGRFTPPNPPDRSGPMEKAWAYPVVAGGRLYLRDHGVLWCYHIAK